MKNLHSQVTQEWTARNKSGSGSSIFVDNLGYIITAGSYGTGTNKDFCTIKYNSSGIQQWISYYNGPGNGTDVINDMKTSTNGNIYVTGSSQGSGTGDDFATIKYNSSGVQKWIGRYTTTGNYIDASYAIAIDSSENIYITGESANDIGGIDYCTIKYDSMGNQLWIKKFNRGKNSSNQPVAIVCDNIGNIFVTGRSDGDIVTIKYSTTGVQLWSIRFDGPLHDEDFPFSIKLDRAFNIYICGMTEGNLNYDDYLLIKYNYDGIEQFSRIYNGTANYLDQARDITIGKSGNIYVTGYATQTGTGYDFTTIKYNANGDQLWLVKYNNGLNDIGKAMAIDSSENIYVTGESDSNGTGFDYTTVKYDSSGNQKWVIRYDYSGQYGDIPSGIAADNSGNVYVTGQSNRDFLTIKYHQTITGINPISLGLPTVFNLEQNFPNPFNPITSFKYQVSKFSNIRIIVHDILGNEVAVLVDENKNPGSYELQWNAKGFSSGIYFYSLQVEGNAIDTKKMLLLK